MNNKHTNNDDSRVWEQVEKHFAGEQVDGGDQLRSMLNNFADDLENHPYVQKHGATQNSSSGQWAIYLKRLAFAASTAAAVVLIGMVVFLGSPTPSWAQISEQFAQSEFLSASLYFKEDGLSTPRHIELWMGRGGKVRIRVGEQLIFGEKGEVIATFDLKTKKQVKADEMGSAILRMLGSDETFSMDTILKGINGGRIVDKTPILNPNAVISEDLVVYDMDSGDESNPQWFRIWALKKSKLPVRIRMWDPRDAQMVDMVLDYSKPQPDIFFDPKAFASTLSTVRTDELNLAYLHLKDAGGKFYVPGIKDENAMMSIMTKTIDGEPFSLSHYADKNVIVLFWDNYSSISDLNWLDKIAKKYQGNEKLEIITVALQKNADAVKQQIESRNIAFTVIHEPGKGFENSLARAMGIKRAYEMWLISGGKAHRIYTSSHEELISLVCEGLNAENEMFLTDICKLMETNKERVADLCGKPHEKLIDGDNELWSYSFTSADKKRRRSVSLRFNKDGIFTGHSSAGSLINPSNIVFEVTKEFWQAKVVAQIGNEDLPRNNSDHHFEIWLKSDKGGAPIIGGGHPRTEINPDTKYNRQLEPAMYSPVVMLIDKSYKRIKEIKLHDGITVGDNENVSIRFDKNDEPIVERSVYRPKAKDNTKTANEYLLKKPDYKKMIKEAQGQKDKYDDPKYLPWQMHLKEVAKRYEDRSLPEQMELIEKNTDEKYQFIMRPQDLPGHEGYSVRAVEGDLKTGYACGTLGAGLMRWPDDVPSVEMNHDLVYRDGVTPKQHYEFMLDEMGYRLEKKTVKRKVFAAKYDGRKLPDPESVSAPGEVMGWGYFNVKGLLDYMTAKLEREAGSKGIGPLFIDETNLPSESKTSQEYQDIAICMEGPKVDSIEDFEKLRPWYEENFGITFVEETRSVEVFVVGKK